MAPQAVVNGIDKIIQRDLCVFGPGIREAVVKEYIQSNWSNSPERGRKLFYEFPGLKNLGAFRIDPAVKHDGVQYGGGVPHSQRGRMTSDKISEHGTRETGVGVGAEVQVGEEIHGMIGM